jgi:hypothetical protein
MTTPGDIRSFAHTGTKFRTFHPRYRKFESIPLRQRVPSLWILRPIRRNSPRLRLHLRDATAASFFHRQKLDPASPCTPPRRENLKAHRSLQ